VRRCRWAWKRKRTEQEIQAQIRSAAQKLEASRKLVATTGDTRQYAYEQLAGEQYRFEGGLSENYRVLEYQVIFSQSEYSELQALISEG